MTQGEPSDSGDPYFDRDGKPALRRSFCVFMDVLGFSSHVATSFAAGKGQEALNRYYEVFTQQLKATFNRDAEGKFRSWDVKVFTDNIVLGYAFDSWHAECEFASVARKVGVYQLLMALDNYFVRGAISVGDLFLDANTVFGPALLEAHNLESTRARDPRVILSPGVVDYVRMHIGFYCDASYAPQTRFVLLDADGELFIHYLNYLTEPYDEVPAIDSEGLAQHKENILKNLELHRRSPKIWAKYQWVANYHDYFCEECREYLGYHDDLAIDRAVLEIRPTRFVPLRGEQAP